MTAVALTSISAIIERIYGRGITRLGLGAKTPLWSVMSKYADFYEETYTLRNRYGRQPSGSRTFATARARAGASSFGSFQLTRNRDYLTMQFAGETLRATSREARRLVTYLKEETDATFEKSARRMNHNAFRNFGGAQVQISSGGNTQTVTVTAATRGALIGITPGMYLVSSNTDGTSGAVDANPTRVSAVDRTAGTITTDAAVSWDNAAGGFSNSDYMFAQGDFGAAMYGLDSWVPSSAPGATTFFGQDRSLDPTYLGGIRYTAAAGDPDGTIERALINAAAEGVLHGAETSHIFMHPLDFAAFVNELGARVQYNTVKGRLGSDAESEVDVGITGIRMLLASGEAMVMPDPDCQRNIAWMLDMRTWGFYGLGMTGYEFDTLDGGGKFLRMSQTDVDGVEANLLIYGQIGCSAPGCNIRVDLTNVI